MNYDGTFNVIVHDACRKQFLNCIVILRSFMTAMPDLLNKKAYKKENYVKQTGIVLNIYKNSYQ